MSPSHRPHVPKPGLLGVGLGLRVGLAALIVLLLWIATAWAVAA